NQ
ncbi:hypothetical protein D044_4230B, partial [Vibrio parahaemolyticus EKP-026]